MGYLTRVKLKDNITDKQKLIHTYIMVLTDHSRSNKLSYNEIIRQIKLNFNYDVTREDVEQYFEPNGSEYELDKQLQINNLGLRYD